MPTLAPAPHTSMLDDLHAATAEHGQRVRDYMLGALAAKLADLPGGPEAWAVALDTSADLAQRIPAPAATYEPPF